MHTKSFTMGLGAGILLVTALFYMMLNYLPVGSGLTADDVGVLAVEFGLIEPDVEVATDENAADELPSWLQPIIEPADEADVADGTDEAEEPTEADVAPMREQVQVQITHNMTAHAIARTLNLYGVIDDPDGFTEFLVTGGLTTRLRAGAHLFEVNSTFEEALAVLTTPSEP